MISDSHDEEWEEREDRGRTKFQELGANTIGLLMHLEDESLKSFRSAAVPVIKFRMALTIRFKVGIWEYVFRNRYSAPRAGCHSDNRLSKP